LIHCDFNEFNVILCEGRRPVLIDLPQMVSIDHANARFYFDRDVECVRTFFRRRFGFEVESVPQFADVVRRHHLDVRVAASGFIKPKRKTRKVRHL
jgi:RIO kinase 2